jgi:hypothetical protein
LKLLRDESIESHVIGLTEECHVFKSRRSGTGLARHRSQHTGEGADFIVEFPVMGFIDLAILPVARCTPRAK